MNRHQAKQELFDKAVTGLVSQGFEQSWNEDDGMCAYRGEGGKRCAVGWLISDERYNPNMEGLNAFDIFTGPLGHRPLIELDAVLSQPLDDEPGAHEEVVRFLLRLQEAHDRNNGELMRAALLSFADEYGLEVSAVPQDG